MRAKIRAIKQQVWKAYETIVLSTQEHSKRPAQRGEGVNVARQELEYGYIRHWKQTKEKAKEKEYEKKTEKSVEVKPNEEVKVPKKEEKKEKSFFEELFGNFEFEEKDVKIDKKVEKVEDFEFDDSNLKNLESFFTTSKPKEEFKPPKKEPEFDIKDKWKNIEKVVNKEVKPPKKEETRSNNNRNAYTGVKRKNNINKNGYYWKHKNKRR